MHLRKFAFLALLAFPLVTLAQEGELTPPPPPPDIDAEPPPRVAPPDAPSSEAPEATREAPRTSRSRAAASTAPTAAEEGRIGRIIGGSLGAVGGAAIGGLAGYLAGAAITCLAFPGGYCLLGGFFVALPGAALGLGLGAWAGGALSGGRGAWWAALLGGALGAIAAAVVSIPLAYVPVLGAVVAVALPIAGAVGAYEWSHTAEVNRGPAVSVVPLLGSDRRGVAFALRF